jgi:Xaa-Pro aminopeptidase
MEYSPGGNNPYVSTVDGGTIDLVRSLGIEVVGSADLLQLFLTWSDDQLENHRRAAQALTETKDHALGLLRQRLAAAAPLDERGLQAAMAGELERRGMAMEHPPIVCFGTTSNDPHYTPPAEGSRPLRPGAVLMDLFCHVAGSDGCCADITWMAHVGTPGDAFAQTFAGVLAARDEGVRFLRGRFEAGEQVRGHEVDRAVRAVLANAGYEPYLLHRTGHSLGRTAAHGEAAHFDGIETLDERLILPGLGFTIEPGVYTPAFGVRSEINVFTLDRGVEITTAIQTELDVL